MIVAEVEQDDELVEDLTQRVASGSAQDIDQNIDQGSHVEQEEDSPLEDNQDTDDQAAAHQDNRTPVRVVDSNRLLEVVGDTLQLDVAVAVVVEVYYL
jgi:hypothetical protein